MGMFFQVEVEISSMNWSVVAPGFMGSNIRLNSRKFRDHICLRAQGTPLGVGGGVWRESGKFREIREISKSGRRRKVSKKSGGEAARNQRALAGFRGEAPEKIF